MRRSEALGKSQGFALTRLLSLHFSNTFLMGMMARAMLIRMEGRLR